MSNPENSKPEVTNKANFYRNKNSGNVSPAFTNPRGYEDEHPEHWEPVSDAVGKAEMAKAKAAAKGGAKAESKAEDADKGEGKGGESAAPVDPPKGAIPPPPPPAK